jgi:hypothetical protein
VEFVWKRGKWIATDTPLEFDLIAKTAENKFCFVELIILWYSFGDAREKNDPRNAQISGGLGSKN